jgi:hypothetical protein
MMVRSNSSNIAHMDYDASSGIMKVKFRDGGTYHYHKVDQHHYDKFVKAESHGKHFHAHIKDKFKFTKE